MCRHVISLQVCKIELGVIEEATLGEICAEIHARLQQRTHGRVEGTSSEEPTSETKTILERDDRCVYSIAARVRAAAHLLSIWSRWEGSAHAAAGT